MELTIEGEVHRICKPFEHENGFRKCEVHIKITDGEYSEIIPVEFLKDMTDEAMTLTVGETIKAKCNIRGREWKSPAGDHRAFLSLNVWTYEVPKPKSIKEQVIEKSKKNEPAADDMPW